MSDESENDALDQKPCARCGYALHTQRNHEAYLLERERELAKAEKSDAALMDAYRRARTCAREKENPQRRALGVFTDEKIQAQKFELDLTGLRLEWSEHVRGISIDDMAQCTHYKHLVCVDGIALLGPAHMVCNSRGTVGCLDLEHMRPIPHRANDAILAERLLQIVLAKNGALPENVDCGMADADVTARCLTLACAFGETVENARRAFYRDWQWPVSEDEDLTAALWQALMLELSSDVLYAITD